MSERSRRIFLRCLRWWPPVFVALVARIQGLKWAGVYVIAGIALTLWGRYRAGIRGADLASAAPAEDPTPLVDAQPIASRTEAVLLLLAVGAFAVLAACMVVTMLGDAVVGLVRGPHHDWRGEDWTLLPAAFGAVVGPAAFLAHALVVQRRLRRAGLGEPSVRQFAGRAAIRAAIAELGRHRNPLVP